MKSKKKTYYLSKSVSVNNIRKRIKYLDLSNGTSSILICPRVGGDIGVDMDTEDTRWHVRLLVCVHHVHTRGVRHSDQVHIEIVNLEYQVLCPGVPTYREADIVR